MPHHQLAAEVIEDALRNSRRNVGSRKAKIVVYVHRQLANWLVSQRKRGDIQVLIRRSVRNREVERTRLISPRSRLGINRKTLLSSLDRRAGNDDFCDHHSNQQSANRSLEPRPTRTTTHVHL